MANPVIESGGFKRVTASALVRSGPAQLLGLFVSAASGTPTVEVLDAVTSGSSTCVAVFTPIAGTWYPMPFSCGTGLTVLIGGTVSSTLSFLPLGN